LASTRETLLGVSMVPPCRVPHPLALPGDRVCCRHRRWHARAHDTKRPHPPNATFSLEDARGSLLILAACAGLIACAPADTPNRPIFLPPPYNTWPPPLPGWAIEPGRPVGLDGPQQVAVTTGVLKWMKGPTSVQFRDMEAVQNSRGLVTVCGEVNGRNSAGKVSISPFIGVLMGPDEDADFVLVGIDSTDRERAEVIQLCRQSGIYGVQ
jgi:hypothetical protein